MAAVIIALLYFSEQPSYEGLLLESRSFFSGGLSALSAPPLQLPMSLGARSALLDHLLRCRAHLCGNVSLTRVYIGPAVARLPELVDHSECGPQLPVLTCDDLIALGDLRAEYRSGIVVSHVTLNLSAKSFSGADLGGKAAPRGPVCVCIQSSKTYGDNLSYCSYLCYTLYVGEISISGSGEDLRVPRGAVERALEDARSQSPQLVSRAVALSVARSSEKTARLRLERLARVMMAAQPDIIDPGDPEAAALKVWGSDWSQATVEVAEALDRAIVNRWSSPATRNAMRDSVRAVFRESLNAGLLTHNQATPLLNALRPEKLVRDEEKQARGHVAPDEVAAVFHKLAQDPELTARRDAALIALLIGAGLRRAEAIDLDLADLDTRQETALVHGKGNTVREVPLAPGVRRAVQGWLDARGSEPGPLFNPVSRTKPRVALVGRRLSTNTVAQVVARRFGEDVAPHDLRRTFTGNLLDEGADLSVVSKILGHSSPATTAGYDRRGLAARRAVIDGHSVPFEDPAES